MKSLFKFLFVFVGVVSMFSAQAQNTGTSPFVNSTHTYSVTKGTVGTTSLAWSISGGTAGTDFNFVGATNAASVDVQWLVAGTYTLQVTETRTDITEACPTTRNITVNVVANTFDVAVALVTAQDACANVSNPVADVSGDGDNSNDVFGTTTRDFTVSMSGGDATKKWSFDYAVNDIAGTNNVAGVLVNGAVSLTGTINVPANTASKTITVVYNTNKNTAGVNGQDPDFAMTLSITNGQDELGTPDSDGTNNSATYNVKAVPATTGITTD